jgi:hypothetical protein
MVTSRLRCFLKKKKQPKPGKRSYLKLIGLLLLATAFLTYFFNIGATALSRAQSEVKTSVLTLIQNASSSKKEHEVY